MTFSTVPSYFLKNVLLSHFLKFLFGNPGLAEVTKKFFRKLVGTVLKVILSVLECVETHSTFIKNSLRTVRGQSGVTEKVFRKWLWRELKVIFECPRVCWNTFQHLLKIFRGQSADSPRTVRSSAFSLPRPVKVSRDKQLNVIYDFKNIHGSWVQQLSANDNRWAVDNCRVFNVPY